jgi:hypothetical protein
LPAKFKKAAGFFANIQWQLKICPVGKVLSLIVVAKQIATS